MLTVTAPVGQRAAQGPQYQHSSTCMKALPFSGLIASESSGQMSTHSVQPSMHSDSSTVTGTSMRLLTRVTSHLPSFGGPKQAATQRDSVSAHSDVFEIDGGPVVEMSESLQEQQRRAIRHLQCCGRM